MNIENLRMFCRVVEEGNISKAARLGYVSQPAVTKQIRQLETRYNTLLFDRQEGKLIPTKAGKTLYPFAKDMVETLEQSHEAVKEATGEYEVVLHIGASFTIGDYLLPNVMGKFKKKFPDYQFSLTIGNTPQITEKLKNQDIDIALVESQVDDHSFMSETFAQDELVLVIPADHRWKDRETITPHELPEEKMIWRESESGTRVILENALQKAGVLKQIQSSLELGSVQSIKSAVEAGLGVSILPKLTVEKELAFGVLKMVPVNDLQLTRDLLMVRELQRFRKQVMHDFVAFVRGS
ncbi:LysR family transcriptional regulator [Lentibacillus sp. N15]|uniref:LysR family transcriptional regulator n=1 Tax=Lentibacillus songyuanensis TaxID=3136161 RepID=UPI0031BBC451